MNQLQFNPAPTINQEKLIDKKLLFFNRFTRMKAINLFVALLFVPILFAQQNVNERVISADIRNEKGAFNTMFKECIGAGRANEGLRSDWQQQLAYVKKNCDFKYIRMHGLLCDDMGVYGEDEKGNPRYNFHNIDVLYDFLLSIGMKPFVELSFMPYALASGNKTIFWWKGNVTPPKDYTKWENLIKSLVKHLSERYGVDEVKKWYFEVWNEPNLDGFWASTQQEYYKLYTLTASAIKSVNPDFRVGGPATAGAAWIPETIEFCTKNNVPIDFISTHSYGVRQGFLDEYGNSGTILDKNPMSVSGDIIHSRQQIKNSSKPNLELHYTEWSASYTPADPIHDSYHSAAYILQKIKQVGNAPNSMSYWVFTDIFEEAGPRFSPFHGGFGLLNAYGINKPAFYSYKFLNMLGNKELQNSDSCSWICKDHSGNIQILCWNYTYTLPDEKINNQDYYIRDLPSKSLGNLKISLKNVPEGNYLMQIYKIGYRSNDAYTTFLDMGKPTELSRQQVQQIKQKNDGSPLLTESIRINSSKNWIKELPLRENDVYLIQLIKK
jgi:xylan 1,4-beta-xylosidase